MRRKVFGGLLLALLLTLAGSAPTPEASSPQEAPAPNEDGEWACGTPQLRDWAVWAAQNLTRESPSEDKLRAMGKMDAEGNLLPDILNQQVTFWAFNWTNYTYYQTTATLKSISARSYVYVEDSNAGRVSQATANSIGSNFDGIYTTITSIFGSEPNPGIDGDSRITILVLDIRDGYTPGGSYISGYFDARNEYDMSNSNQREMFFMDLNPFNPNTNTTAFMGVLAHEFQHMIHWNLDPDEDTWVNEGASDLAYYLAGYGHLGGHVRRFLEKYDESLTQWSSTSADYGAAYMFLLYFWEKYGGNDAIRALVAEQANGIAGFNNVLAARGYSDRFRDLFNRWVVANYLDDTSIGSSPYLYAYNTLDLVESGANNITSFARPATQVWLLDLGSPVSSSYNASPWAANYHRFYVGTSAQGSTMYLSFDGYDSAGALSATLVKSTSTTFAAGSNTIQDMALNATRDFFTSVPGMGTAYQRVLLIPSMQGNPPPTIAGAIPYTFTASTTPPSLRVSPSSLPFLARFGGAAAGPLSLLVEELGGGSLAWSAAKPPADTWLTFSPSSGGSMPATISVTANPSGLITGTYTSAITVVAAASGTLNSPQIVTVTLKVGAISDLHLPNIMRGYGGGW